jgi:magnesium chelatase family protein
MLLLGPYGAGTSMLARRLTTILPAMTLAEAIETARIHSMAGHTGGRTAWVTTRPCRAPHQTIADVGLIGAGAVPMPGDVSLAHHGMLLLDELPALKRHVRYVLRQPLEEGAVCLSSRERHRFQCSRDDRRTGPVTRRVVTPMRWRDTVVPHHETLGHGVPGRRYSG